MWWPESFLLDLHRMPPPRHSVGDEAQPTGRSGKCSSYVVNLFLTFRAEFRLTLEAGTPQRVQPGSS